MEYTNKHLQASFYNRKMFESYLNGLSLQDLFKIPNGYRNNIVWQVGHIISVQQQLVYLRSGLPLKIPVEFSKKYGRGSTPDEVINEEDFNEIKSLLFNPIEELEKDLQSNIFENYEPLTTLPGMVLSNVNDALEFNNFHDTIHLKRCEALKQAIIS